MSEEKRQKVFTVYRMSGDKTKVPIGHIVERRKSLRHNNRIGLLQLARKKFTSLANETIFIGVCDEWSAESQKLNVELVAPGISA